jgi:hypothetical protein
VQVQPGFARFVLVQVRPVKNPLLASSVVVFSLTGHKPSENSIKIQRVCQESRLLLLPQVYLSTLERRVV